MACDAPYTIHEFNNLVFNLALKRKGKKVEYGMLTAKGHHRGEEHHSLGQRIQAASLISQGPPTRLPVRTSGRAHYAAHCSC